MDDIRTALGTSVKMTVFRKLKTMGYRSSYSHAGKYYTTNDIAQFNETGLWSYNRVHFSIDGTLVKTLYRLVETSPQGYFASELQDLLKVRIHDPLFKLYLQKKIRRHQIGSAFLYLSISHGTKQLAERQQLIKASVESQLLHLPAYDSPGVRQSLSLFLSLLNEKQRRLFVGFESMKIGRGGDKIISKITGIDVRTISMGRQQLLSHNITPDRIREQGAGRPSLKKNRNSEDN